MWCIGTQLQVIREGDPVHQMFFIVQGSLQMRHILYTNELIIYHLGPGDYFGDEVISWCLRVPFEETLPPSTATIVTTTAAEVYIFECQDMKYVIDHYRHMFETSKMKSLLRYHSLSWRMWAAVTIQKHWRKVLQKRRKKHKQLQDPSTSSVMAGMEHLGGYAGSEDERMRDPEKQRGHEEEEEEEGDSSSSESCSSKSGEEGDSEGEDSEGEEERRERRKKHMARPSSGSLPEGRMRQIVAMLTPKPK